MADYGKSLRIGMAAAERLEKVRKKAERASKKELRVMLKALSENQGDYFRLGRYAATKKLSNGAVVRFSIQQPPQVFDE